MPGEMCNFQAGIPQGFPQSVSALSAVCSGTVERYSRLLWLIKPTGNILITPSDGPVSAQAAVMAPFSLRSPSCGHVDSGKCTTTGRLISGSGGLPERQLEKLKAVAVRLGKCSFAPCFLHGPSEGGAWKWCDDRLHHQGVLQ